MAARVGKMRPSGGVDQSDALESVDSVLGSEGVVAVSDDLLD
jgi:hypothetical protein